MEMNFDPNEYIDRDYFYSIIGEMSEELRIFWLEKTLVPYSPEEVLRWEKFLGTRFAIIQLQYLNFMASYKIYGHNYPYSYDIHGRELNPEGTFWMESSKYVDERGIYS